MFSNQIAVELVSRGVTTSEDLACGDFSDIGLPDGCLNFGQRSRRGTRRTHLRRAIERAPDMSRKGMASSSAGPSGGGSGGEAAAEAIHLVYRTPRAALARWRVGQHDVAWVASGMLGGLGGDD